MKKLLLGLACAASLGLWMSCSDSNELDVTTHKGVETVYYEYAGTVTATRYVYKPVELGTTEPTSGKYYSITEDKWDEEKSEYVYVTKYFHNIWVADKTPVTDNVATIEWETNTTGATQTNMARYDFCFRDNDISNYVEKTIRKIGDTYSASGIAITLTAGTLDGTTFTIKELPYANPNYLPDEDERYYYDENRPQYVYYGNITYTRSK